MPTLACANFEGLFFHCANVLSCDFFGSLAPRVFPSLFLLSEGRDGGGRSWDALVLLPESFPLLPLDLVQQEGWRSLASVSSVHSWTGGPGVALLRRTPATFSVPVGSPSSPLHARRGDGAEESSGRFFSVLGYISRLISARSARRVRLPSAAPVRVPPWPPDLQLGRPGGYLSLLSCAVSLLTLSLRLPCSVRQSRRCGRGSSQLFSLVRSR